MSAPLHLSPSNKSGWTRRLSLAIISGASEKIRPQIHRPSFSDSLLTADSKTLLIGVEKRVSGPSCAFSRPRRVRDSKMLPKSGQDLFCWSNHVHSALGREEGAGTQYTLCRGRSVPRLSPRSSLHTFAQHHSVTMQGWRKSAGLGSKSTAERPWGWESTPHCIPSTISTFVQYMIRDIFPIPMR